MKQSYDQSLGHELGPNWFINAFWPDIHGRSYGIHYAGPVDDWLDEAAAICLETWEMTASRYKNLADHRTAGRVIPLEEFFAMEHPKRPADVARDAAGGRSAEGQVREARARVG